MAFLRSDYNFSKRYTGTYDLTIPSPVPRPTENEPKHLQGDSLLSSPAGHCFRLLPMHLPSLAPTMAVQSRIDVQAPPHARPPAPPTGRQPHRRRRGGRTSWEGGEGAG